MEYVDLKAAVSLLRGGRPLIFETDTVVGVGVSPLFAADPSELYILKGRDERKPIAWLVSSPSDISRFGAGNVATAQVLAERFWPGALTLIVRASEDVAPSFRSEAGTIGLRMPDSRDVLGLLDASRTPLATTSANLTGCPPASDLDELDPDFANGIAVYNPEVPAAPHTGVASTVVDCTFDPPKVLREGTIPVSDIEAALSGARETERR